MAKKRVRLTTELYHSLKLCWLVGAAPALLVLTSWLQRGEQSTLQLLSSEAVQGFFKVFGAKGVFWEYFRGPV